MSYSAPPPQPPPPAPPYPWQLLYTPDGRPYYLNRQTGKTAWNLPPAASAGPAYGAGRGMPVSAGSNAPSDAQPRYRGPDPFATQPGYSDAGTAYAYGHPPTDANTTQNTSQNTSQARRQEPSVHLSGNPRDRAGASERLDPSYKVRTDPSKFFRVGKVFLTLHAENTNAPLDGRSEITLGFLKENIFTEISRFVVIRENKGSCAALRILTYGKRGCGKPGILKSDHAIIHTGREPPDPLSNECTLKRGEEPMQSATFKVTPAIDGEKLDPLSRINLGKVYTIEHNVKVRGFGKVDNFQLLYYVHKAIWDQGPAPTLALPEVPEHSASPPHYPVGSPSGSRTYSSGPSPAAGSSNQPIPGQPYGRGAGAVSSSQVAPYSVSPQHGTNVRGASPYGKSPMTEDQMRSYYASQNPYQAQQDWYQRQQQQQQQQGQWQQRGRRERQQEYDDEDDDDSERSDNDNQDPRRK